VQGRRVACRLAELGQLGEEREGDHPADAGHALEQIVLDLPERTRLHRGVQVVIRLTESALEEADVLLEIAPNRRPGDEEAVALGGEHLDQLPASGEERVERLDRVLGERTRLRSPP
jgi:hypothetical protein